MNKFFLIIFSTIILIVMVGEIAYSHGDDDDDEHEFEANEYLNNKKTSFRNRAPNIEPVKNALYSQECSSCHFDYSRGMLPERSWRLLMSAKSLEDHFEEVVILEEADRLAILGYLVAGSAEKSKYKISKKITRSIKKNETPKRISKIRYIRRKHKEIPDRYVIKNAKVRSLSQCSACHQRIGKGIIDEDEVYIPYKKLK